MAKIIDKTPQFSKAAAGAISGYLGTRREIENQDREFAMQEQRLQTQYEVAQGAAAYRERSLAMEQSRLGILQRKEEANRVANEVATGLRAQGSDYDPDAALTDEDRALWQYMDEDGREGIRLANQANFQKAQIEKMVASVRKAVMGPEGTGVWTQDEADRLIEALESGAMTPEEYTQLYNKQIGAKTMEGGVARHRLAAQGWMEEQLGTVNPIEHPEAYTALSMVVEALNNDPDTSAQEAIDQFKKEWAGGEGPGAFGTMFGAQRRDALPGPEGAPPAARKPRTPGPRSEAEVVEQLQAGVDSPDLAAAVASMAKGAGVQPGDAAGFRAFVEGLREGTLGGDPKASGKLLEMRQKSAAAGKAKRHESAKSDAESAGQEVARLQGEVDAVLSRLETDKNYAKEGVTAASHLKKANNALAKAKKAHDAALKKLAEFEQKQ